jgi:hypothetical protein
MKEVPSKSKSLLSIKSKVKELMNSNEKKLERLNLGNLYHIMVCVNIILKVLDISDSHVAAKHILAINVIIILNNMR